MDADIGKFDVCHQEKEGVTFQEQFFCQVHGESNSIERKKETGFKIEEHKEGLKLSWW